MPAHSPFMLSVRHGSWIRQQIRDLVLHLDAPVETAELLQVALISLAHAVIHHESVAPASSQAEEEGFVSEVRRQVREDLIDEVRQMTHLSRLQRRHWLLVKVARQHLLRRLQNQRLRREPSCEEISVITGLSVTEVDVLQRMARIGPWEPEQGSQQLMELRSLKPAAPSQLLRARLETRAVLGKVAELLAQCPRERLIILHRHFGVSCLMNGRSLLPDAPPATRGWILGLVQRLLAAGMDRRPKSAESAEAIAVPAVVTEELWPQNLAHLLSAPPVSSRSGLHSPPRH